MFLHDCLAYLKATSNIKTFSEHPSIGLKAFCRESMVMCLLNRLAKTLWNVRESIEETVIGRNSPGSEGPAYHKYVENADKGSQWHLPYGLCRHAIWAWSRACWWVG